MSEIKINHEYLEDTQNKRKQLLEKFEELPKFHLDPDVVNVYVKVLSDMDDQELKKLKIKKDEEASDKNRHAIMAARDLASSFTRKGENPFMKRDNSGMPVVEIEEAKSRGGR